MAEDDSWKATLTPRELLESAIRDKVDPADPGDLERAAEALARGADINERTHDGWTALMHAAIENDAAMIDFLLAHGAVDDGRAVLEAARCDAAGSLASLIRHGCWLEFDEHGDTPLIIAAREGNLTVVPLLIAAGADLDRCDDSGTSARMYLEGGTGG